MMDGADHLITIPYEEVYVATCPIKAVEQWIAVVNHAGWGMAQGYLCPHTTAGAKEMEYQREKIFVPNSSTNLMTVLLRQHSAAANENQEGRFRERVQERM